MKPNYHQSRLINYPVCPKKFELSLTHNIPETDAMRHGNLFEGYVLGFKPDKNEQELIGRKKPVTIDGIKKDAELVKPLFLEGESYVKLSYDNGKYIKEGEADFIGYVKYGNSKIKCIADLKYSGDIAATWNYAKRAKADFLQSVYYPSIWYDLHKEILPFLYIIVENKYDSPLVKYVLIEVTKEDFKWVKTLCDAVYKDKNKYAKPGEGTCVNNWGKIRCPYLEHCEEGREYVAGSINISFSDLEDNLELGEIEKRELAEQEFNQLIGG